MKEKSKYFEISLEKERDDTASLLHMIKEDGWIDSSTIIVNCSPDYSSRLSQTINHQLSVINKNELLEQIELEMPYPNTNQIWNKQEKEYQSFDSYLKRWVATNIFTNKFLFVDAGTLRGKNFNKVKLSVRPRLENELFRFASLYIQDDSIFIPDYYIETFNKEKHGGLLFEWENPLNPNWDY